MAKDYGLVTTEQELRDLVELLDVDRTIGFDVETGYDGDPRDRGAVDPRFARIVGFSITNSRHWARYVPVGHDEGPNIADALLIVAPLLRRRRVVAHNAGFERRMLKHHGIEVEFFSDTMLEAYCFGAYAEHGLKPLTLEVFDHQMAEITSLWPGITAAKKKKIRFNDRSLDDEAVVNYACEDAAWCLALHEHHYPRLEGGRKDTLDREMQVLPIVSDMEYRGLEIDFRLLRRWAYEGEQFAQILEKEVVEKLADMAGTTPEGLAEIAESPGGKFNVGSSQQLSKVLFDHVGLTVNWTTDTGKPSTSEPALTKLAKEHEQVAALLEYRQLKKLIGSYLKKWPNSFSTGKDRERVHPGWKQNGVPSGRFAVADPGVQQCPKNFSFTSSSLMSFGGNFRDCIIPSREFYFLDFDYSQIELRVLAGMAQETKLLDAFASGLDPHVLTAALIFDKDASQVTEKERSSGKTFNFALLYQMGKKSLAERLGVPQRRANLLYNRFFEGYDAVNDWIEEQIFTGRAKEYATTHFGRRIPILEFGKAREYGADGNIRKAQGVEGHGERLCVNAPVQGTAADIAKMAMVSSQEALREAGIDQDRARLVVNNHDELMFEVHGSLMPEYMVSILRPAVEFDIDGFPPLETDWETGPSWGQIQEVKG